MSGMTGLIGITTCRMTGMIGETRLTKMTGNTGVARVTGMTGMTCDLGVLTNFFSFSLHKLQNVTLDEGWIKHSAYM